MKPALTLVLCATLAGCFGSDPCRTACARLQMCEVLPGVLGAETPRISARLNCVARCENSSRTVRMEILACTDPDAGSTCPAVERCIAERTLPPDAGSDAGE